MSTEYKSSSNKIIPILENSRDNWKSKHQTLKTEHRNLERRHQYALDQISKFKERVAELEAKLKKNDSDEVKKRRK